MSNSFSRYISLERFEDVCSQGLFLANPIFFKDTQEGHIAVKSIFPNIDSRSLEKIEIMKSYFYVNSWYTGEESKEMRSQYGEICIETSLEQLKNICRKYGENNPTHNVIIGKVQYLNSSDSIIGQENRNWEWDCWGEKNYNPQSGFNLCSIITFKGLFLKYDNFSFEKEVRLICDSFHGGNKGVAFKNDKNGVRIPLNTSFFSRIVLSADKFEVMKTQVEGILRKHGYETEIVCL